MRDFFNDLKKNILCKRTRNKMLSAYLSNEYFGFDDNLHASSCIKCQVSGKRYKAFKEELDNELQKDVEVPTDFASKVMSSLDKKVKTTTTFLSSEDITFEAQSVGPSTSVCHSLSNSSLKALYLLPDT